MGKEEESGKFLWRDENVSRILRSEWEFLR